jgi:tetratricopeptide (TPR) repeat protein
MRRAIELNPNYASAYHWLGLVLSVRGQDDDAGVAMGRALELDPLAHIVHIAFAEMLLESGDAETAKAHLLRARDLEPDYPGVAAGLARAEMTLWNWRGAEDALAIGLHRNPNNTAALGAKVHLALMLGDVDAARDALERAESIDPDAPDVWTQRAVFEHRTGNTEAGLRGFERVAEARPEDPFSAVRIASCLLSVDRVAEAQRWIEQVEAHRSMKLGKSRLIVDTFRGIVAARQGRAEDTERALAAIRSASHSTRIHASAVFVLVAAGRHDEALDELEQALAVHDPWLTELPIEPLMRPIRSHARFQQVLDVMGLGSGVVAPR